MTREKLEEIKKLAEAATPGPYQVASIYPAYGVFRVEVDEPSECVAMCAVSMNEDADEPHVERQEAHARNGTNARAIAALLQHALPLIEALEWQAAMTKALSESQERLVQEVKESRAEVELLRAEVRKQVFSSRVVFDREVVERAQAALEAALKEGK